jgi:hypothetical protein
VPDAFWTAADNQQAIPGRFHARETMVCGWEAGGKPDPMPPVDLASLAAGGNHPGARWRLDGEDLQANLIRLDQGDRIQPTATTRSRCWRWSSQARAS